MINAGGDARSPSPRRGGSPRYAQPTASASAKTVHLHLGSLHRTAATRASQQHCHPSPRQQTRQQTAPRSRQLALPTTVDPEGEAGVASPHRHDPRLDASVTAELRRTLVALGVDLNSGASGSLGAALAGSRGPSAGLQDGLRQLMAVMGGEGRSGGELGAGTPESSVSYSSLVAPPMEGADGGLRGWAASLPPPRAVVRGFIEAARLTTAYQNAPRSGQPQTRKRGPQERRQSWAR